MSLGTINGTISGSSVTLTAVSGIDDLKIEGTVLNDAISGTYAVTSGACAGDSGTFTLSRDTNGSESNATVLASAIASPAFLTVNANSLYWSDASTIPVKKVSVADKNLAGLVHAMGDPESMIVSGGSLYWIGAAGDSALSCTGQGVFKNLVKSGLDGSASTVLAHGENCADGTNDLVADDTELYWVNAAASPNTYTIEKVSKSGSAESTIYTTSTPIVSMTSDATYLYWLEEDFPSAGIIKKMPLGGGTVSTVLDANGTYNAFVGNIAVEGTDLFVAEVQYPYPGGATLLKVDLNTSAVTALGDMTTLPRKLTVDNTNVYWIDADSVNLMPRNGGSAVTLAGGLESPVDIRLYGSDVFWVETVCCAHGQTGRIKSIPVTGGAVTTVIDNVNAPQSLAMNGTDLYWIEGGPIGLTEGFGRIAMMPLGGGADSTVINGVVPGIKPIAVDDSNLYFADRWMIKKLPKAGGQIANVAEGNFTVHDIATDGVDVYWIEDGPYARVAKVAKDGGTVEDLSNTLVGPSGPMMVLNGYVYWMAHYDTIARVPVGGGVTETIASGLPLLSDFTTDGTDIYFTEQDTGKIRKISIGGGALTDLVTLTGATWRVLAVDDTDLFWIDQTELGMIPKTGGTSTVIRDGLVSEASVPNSIIVDGANLYWTEVGSGTVYMMPKP